MRTLPIALSAVVVLAGCLSFGPEASTTAPTAAQVKRCRAEMYLQPDLKLKPLGFKMVSGIDAAIWFKFEAPSPDPAKIFRSDVVDTSGFAPGVRLDGGGLPSWWDVAGKKLLGGQVALPNARFMNVGIHPIEGGRAVVYVMWHET